MAETGKFSHEEIICDPHDAGGRCGGLLVSTLVSGSNGQGPSPGRGCLVKFLGSHYPGRSVNSDDELNAGGNPAMDKHAIQGEVEILVFDFVLQKLGGIGSSLMGHFASM